MFGESEINQLAAAYLRNHEDDEAEDAFEEMLDLTSNNPALACKVIAQMFALVSSRREIGMIAAGALEDVLRNNDRVVERKLTDLYAQSSRFQYALTLIYTPSPNLDWLDRLVADARTKIFTLTELDVKD